MFSGSDGLFRFVIYMEEVNDNVFLTVERIKHCIKSGLKLLKEYSYLIDSYVLDFFVDNHWDKLPKTWQNVLKDASPEEISSFLSGNRTSSVCKQHIYPLSLLAFRAACLSSSVQREAIDSPKYVLKFLEEISTKPLTKKNSVDFQKKEEGPRKDKRDFPHELNVDGWWGSAKSEFTKCGGQHKGLHHLFRRHVKPKKQHEIVRLAQVIAMSVGNLDYSYVIDVGAGQGHLSRLLSYSTNLKVIAIEAENTHVSGAQKFADQVSVTLNKKNIKNKCSPQVSCTSYQSDDSSPINVLRNIPDNVNSCEFEKIIAESIGKGELNGNFALVGLHTCGNLATTLLNVFTSCPKALALFSVACCYMKLSNETNDIVGYPLSNFVRSLPNSRLSYCAREAACHALEKHCEKLNGAADFLKIHCYRAVLEKLIIQHYPTKKHLGLRSVKRAVQMEFSQYAKLALEHTGVSIPEDSYLSSNIKDDLMNWKHVVIFYCLRLLLASVVETIILYDRMIFLNEKGIDCCLLPLFDPNISPRNHILIAMKKK